MKTRLLWPAVFSLMIFLIGGCAGISADSTADITAKYYVFPFRNPSYQDKEFSDVGMRFTNAFAAACAKHSLDVTIVMNDQFDSSKDTNVQDAIVYAMEAGAEYIIYGYVTKWVDRPTSLTSARDFAGLSIFVRSVESGEVVFSSEIQAHGIRYSRHGSGMSQLGLPYTQARVNLVDSLSTEMAERFLGM
jgi:hypothetical protein